MDLGGGGEVRVQPLRLAVPSFSPSMLHWVLPSRAAVNSEPFQFPVIRYLCALVHPWCPILCSGHTAHFLLGRFVTGTQCSQRTCLEMNYVAVSFPSLSSVIFPGRLIIWVLELLN